MPREVIQRYANTRRRSHLVYFAKGKRGPFGPMYSTERCNLDDSKEYEITEEPLREKCKWCTSGVRFPS